MRSWKDEFSVDTWQSLYLERLVATPVDCSILTFSLATTPTRSLVSPLRSRAYLKNSMHFGTKSVYTVCMDKPFLNYFKDIDVVSTSRYFVNVVSISCWNWISQIEASLIVRTPCGDADASLTAAEDGASWRERVLRSSADSSKSYSVTLRLAATCRWAWTMPLRRGPGGSVDIAGRFHEPGIHHGSYTIGRNYVAVLLEVQITHGSQ